MLELYQSLAQTVLDQARRSDHAQDCRSEQFSAVLWFAKDCDH